MQVLHWVDLRLRYGGIVSYPAGLVGDIRLVKGRRLWQRFFGESALVTRGRVSRGVERLGAYSREEGRTVGTRTFYEARGLLGKHVVEVVAPGVVVADTAVLVEVAAAVAAGYPVPVYFRAGVCGTFTDFYVNYYSSTGWLRATSRLRPIVLVRYHREEQHGTRNKV